MTRDDVIRMAREAGFWVNDDGSFNGGDDSEFGLLNFATLVVAAEREACAKVCEGWVSSGFYPATVIAKAIRARNDDGAPATD